MSSSGLSEKKLEKKLRLVGYKLEKPASSTEELVSHLENAEKLLPFVKQRPQRSMEKAMLPLMTALIMDAILKHPDPNVQVTVASCHSELVRITAPEFTYEDEHMKDLFRLFLVAFNYLSCGEGINFERAVRILEIMAKARSCLMMMDMEIDHMIVEMFQLFLNIIRPNHSADIFKYMKTIMVMIIEESDEISVELLTPLLASVKMDNKSSSLRSWELGNSVFENCAIKLQDSVRKTMKEMNLNVSDYAEIVASLNQDIPTGEAMVANEEVTNAQFVIKRSIKRNTLMTPEEGYQHGDLARDSGSSRVYDCRDNRSVQAVPRKPTGKLPHHKVVESPTAEPSLSGKCGRELVNARVMIWWPLDKAYYAGTIVSFDPLTSKHGIEYDDGDEEMLNLSEERWELYNETPFQL